MKKSKTNARGEIYICLYKKWVYITIDTWGLIHGNRHVTRHIGLVSRYMPKGLWARWQIWSAGPICLVMWQQPCFKLFYYMFTRESLHRGDVNDVIYDAEGTREGLYGYTLASLWVRVWTDVFM